MTKPNSFSIFTVLLGVLAFLSSTTYAQSTEAPGGGGNGGGGASSVVVSQWLIAFVLFFSLFHVFRQNKQMN